MPVPRVARATAGKGTGKVLSAGGTAPRIRSRTPAVRGGSAAGWNLLTPCESPGCHYRILYFSHGAIAAVVAYGIVKEGAVPPREIDRAIERKKRFEANPAKHRQEERTK